MSDLVTGGNGSWLRVLDGGGGLSSRRSASAAGILASGAGCSVSKLGIVAK